VSEIRFYHLQRQSLNEALPKLMEKVYSTGAKAVIKAEESTVLQQLDQALWGYDVNSFIPHASEGTKAPGVQPIYLTTSDDNPAGASIQVLINATSSETTDSYDKCLYMFDGRDEAIVASARAAWKAFKEKEYEMSYWQQHETGGWEQKA